MDAGTMYSWFSGFRQPAILRTPVLVVLGAWSFFWTAFALWHAARRSEKGWFIFFLFVHTMGLVELYYLIVRVRAFTPDARKPAAVRKTRSGK